MIDKAQEYVWATGRVLEQRRFEFLFGDGGDPAAVKAALEPYKTSDGGYGYALEPDGRGPTSQPPHIWTALEVLEELGETDSGVGDHIASLTAPDGGVPVALPRLEPYPRAPWWGIGTKGTLLATALLYSRAPRRARLADGRRGLLLARDRGHRDDPPVRGRVRDHVPGRRVGPRPGGRAGGAARHARARAEPRRHAARGLLAGRDPPPAQLRRSAGHHWRGRGSATPRSRAASTTSSPSSASTAAGRSRGRIWLPAIPFEWSGIITIDALKVLRAYGRV